MSTSRLSTLSLCGGPADAPAFGSNSGAQAVDSVKSKSNAGVGLEKKSLSLVRRIPNQRHGHRFSVSSKGGDGPVTGDEPSDSVLSQVQESDQGFVTFSFEDRTPSSVANPQVVTYLKHHEKKSKQLQPKQISEIIGAPLPSFPSFVPSLPHIHAPKPPAPADPVPAPAATAAPSPSPISAPAPTSDAPVPVPAPTPVSGAPTPAHQSEDVKAHSSVVTAPSDNSEAQPVENENAEEGQSEFASKLKKVLDTVDLVKYVLVGVGFYQFSNAWMNFTPQLTFVQKLYSLLPSLVLFWVSYMAATWQLFVKSLPRKVAEVELEDFLSRWKRQALVLAITFVAINYLTSKMLI